MKDLGLSASLLNSVTGVLKDSSAQRAEQSKVMSEKLNTQYSNKMGVARPRTQEEARQATLEGRAPQRRVSDSITQVYAKSMAEHNARVKEEAAAIEKAYAKMGASKPISESIDESCSSSMKAKKAEEESNKARKAKQKEAVDESEEVTLSQEEINRIAELAKKFEEQ